MGRGGHRDGQVPPSPAHGEHAVAGVCRGQDADVRARVSGRRGVGLGRQSGYWARAKRAALEQGGSASARALRAESTSGSEGRRRPIK